MYYVYMVRCQDGSLYTGLAKYLCRRMREHVARDTACAKYTRSRPVVALEAVWRTETRSAAAALEAFLKTLPRVQKLALTQDPAQLLPRYGQRLKFADYTPLPDLTLSTCLDGTAAL